MNPETEADLRRQLIELRKTLFLIKLIVLPEDVPWTDDQLISELLKKFPPDGEPPIVSSRLLNHQR